MTLSPFLQTTSQSLGCRSKPKKRLCSPLHFALLFPAVSVGYEYESCPDLILWEKRTAVLQGYEIDASKLGGWSLDKHHALNIQSGKCINGIPGARPRGGPCLVSIVPCQIKKKKCTHFELHGLLCGLSSEGLVNRYSWVTCSVLVATRQWGCRNERPQELIFRSDANTSQAVSGLCHGWCHHAQKHRALGRGAEHLSSLFQQGVSLERTSEQSLKRSIGLALYIR